MRLELKVIPKSSRNVIVEEGGTLRVYVTAAPDKGKANKAVIDLLSERYGVPKRCVRFIKGESSRTKVVEVLTDG
ncbi:MAG: DUF167 domain-containing protein [Candidatus Omnitrophica bacterium]|nr:DUF167 domain-containing protein [Candidatus Omnitrophota bacterium]MDD5488360.1 DUF167 domain-containing protein [Candidatus Omnitrophota bacterium]